MSADLYQLTSNAITAWYNSNARDLPWRHTTDPYLIWVSEIILQQTTIAQGLDYYNRFVEKYPNVQKLADAPLDDVMKLWQGLGYYSRARNMHAAAQQIISEHNGVFPDTYNDIIKLKGIGKYTAAAIASFSYNLNYPVVDGNVIRFLTRYFGIRDIIELATTQKALYNHAQKLIDHQTPSIWNQAIMEFGSQYCSYKKPLCQNCPINKNCVALAQNLVDKLPVKKTKKKKKNRYFFYLIIKDNSGHVLIDKRRQKDIWQELYQFPLIECNTLEEYTFDPERYALEGIAYDINPSRLYKQTLTHQLITAQFFVISLDKPFPKSLEEKYIKVPWGAIKTYSWPKVIDLYFSDLSITLF